MYTITACQPNAPAPKPAYTALPQQAAASHIPTFAPARSGTPAANPVFSTQDAPVDMEILGLGLTFQEIDGNRVITGSGGFPYLEAVDVQLPGKATWLIATEVDDGIMWTAALEDGRAYSFWMNAKGMVNNEPIQSALPAGMPPAAISNGTEYRLIQVEDPEQSPLTHPVFLKGSGMRAYVTRSGELRFVNANDQTIASLEVSALPDARILVDEQERLLLLTGPTDRYAHGVLGDSLEAASISLIETMPEPIIKTVISMPENNVIEGLSPIWTDLTGDGQREIVITVSDSDLGAGITVLDESGNIIAEGDKMGIPYRWRHQIAVSNFDPQGGLDIAVVRTPHIAGTVEFYRLEDGKLSIAAEFPGVTSHTIGSSNLDMAAAGDFDGDNLNELLVLTPDLTEIIAVRKTVRGAEAAWQLPLGDRASSNIAGANLPGGRVVLGLGRNDGVLRFWLPGS